jgi:hypothetical protein
MPSIGVVLAVLIGALALAAAGALVLADRAVAPVRRTMGGTSAAPKGAGAALQASRRRNLVGVGTSVIALVAGAAASNVFWRNVVGDAVFAAPLVASAAGVLAFGLLQRRLLSEPLATAALQARLVHDFSRRRSFVAVGLLAALLIALAIFAAVATPVAAFVGARAIVLPVSLAVLVVAAVFALHRVASRAALPGRLAAVDTALRQAGNRFVLLLTAAGMLATIAAVAVQAGGWLWEAGPVLFSSSSTGEVWTVAGIAVSVVGAGAGIGAVAAVGSLLAASARGAAPTVARPRTASIDAVGVDA